MNTEIDWQRELDALVRHRSTTSPPGHYVAAGHRPYAVAAPRLAGLAAAALVAGIAWSWPRGPPRSDEAPIATDPTSRIRRAGDDRGRPDRSPHPPWGTGDPPARSARRPRVRPGAVVHERRNDLYPGKDTDSVALDVSLRGRALVDDARVGRRRRPR